MTRILAWQFRDPRSLTDLEFTSVDPLWIGVVPEIGMAFRTHGTRFTEVCEAGDLATEQVLEWTAQAEEQGLTLRSDALVCEVGEVYRNDLRNNKLSHLPILIARILNEGERVPW